MSASGTPCTHCGSHSLRWKPPNRFWCEACRQWSPTGIPYENLDAWAQREYDIAMRDVERGDLNLEAPPKDANDYIE